jgi:DNA topoisomerase IA
MPWLRMNDERNTIDTRKGDSVNIVNIKLEENKTKPPSYLSEAELISLVMKLNISINFKKIHLTIG